MQIDIPYDRILRNVKFLSRTCSVQSINLRMVAQTLQHIYKQPGERSSDCLTEGSNLTNVETTTQKRGPT